MSPWLPPSMPVSRVHLPLRRSPRRLSLTFRFRSDSGLIRIVSVLAHLDARSMLGQPPVRSSIVMAA
jgi:hypothetical protein